MGENEKLNTPDEREDVNTSAQEDIPAAKAGENTMVEKEPSAEKTTGNEKKPKKKKKFSLARELRKEKYKRGGLATILTVVFVAVVVVVNILVGLLSDRFPSMNVDLTAQKLNTLSEQAQEVADGITEETEIYLIGSEDFYRKNENQYYTSYGVEFSQVANLADKLAESNSLISAEFIDPDLNPQFISEYADEDLTSGCVLVKSARRYKALSPMDLFNVTRDSDTYEYKVYTNVDSCLAGALEIVNMEKVPVIAIATGHTEALDGNLTEFTNMMERQNYEVKEFNVFSEEIPENTAVVFIPTPMEDYTEGEVEKIRQFLLDTQRAEDIGVLMSCYPTQGDTPNLDRLLEEWGVKVEEGVVAESDPNRVATYDESFILADKTDAPIDGDFNQLVAAYSCPLTVLFTGNGDVGVQELWTTADTSYVITENTTEEEIADPNTEKHVVATLSMAYQKVDGDNYQRSLSVFGSSMTFTDAFVSSSAFGNGSYLEDLFRYMTGTGGSSVTVYTNPVQTNTLDISMSAGLITTIGLGIFTIGLPLAILIMGLVVFLKRRHL